MSHVFADTEEVRRRLDEIGYLVDEGMAAALFFALTLGQPLLPELAPITGPMYQLFIFFMITDPRTVVKGRRAQIMVTILIAIAELMIRYASDQNWALPTAFNAAPPLVALWLVGPVAKFIDLRRTPRSGT